MRHRLGRAALSNCRGHERSPAMDWTGTAPSRSPGSGAQRISRMVPRAGKNGRATWGRWSIPPSVAMRISPIDLFLIG